MVVFALSIAQFSTATPESAAEKFAQLEPLLDTPAEVRLVSGAPGPNYWQQRADYQIEVTLDDARQHISGRQTVTYHNKSPHPLSYFWLQLDQNRSNRKSSSLSLRPGKPPSGKRATHPSPAPGSFALKTCEISPSPHRTNLSGTQK